MQTLNARKESDAIAVVIIAPCAADCRMAVYHGSPRIEDFLAKLLHALHHVVAHSCDHHLIWWRSGDFARVVIRRIVWTRGFPRSVGIRATCWWLRREDGVKLRYELRADRIGRQHAMDVIFAQISGHAVNVYGVTRLDLDHGARR